MAEIVHLSLIVFYLHTVSFKEMFLLIGKLEGKGGKALLETWKICDREVKVSFILREVTLFCYGFGKGKG